MDRQQLERKRIDLEERIAWAERDGRRHVARRLRGELRAVKEQIRLMERRGYKNASLS